MDPMFAELFMKPDEELEAGDRRRLRRARRSGWRRRNDWVWRYSSQKDV